MQIVEQLKEKVYEAVENVEASDVAVAFSGGVDSSLLAKVCRDVGKNVILLTVGFSSERDIEISRHASIELGLTVFYDVISLERLETGLRTVMGAIEFDRIARLENCLGFYYVFRLASKHGRQTVLSANGLDELFCGYNTYRTLFGDEAALRDLMKSLVETARKDKEEMDKLASLVGVKYSCPFLSDGFVDFSMKIPSEFKIKSGNDEVRKHILREIALEMGVPESAALRRKKAFQYSSGVHKAIRMLARKAGFTRKYARTAGYRGEIEAYIEKLRKSLGSD